MTLRDRLSQPAALPTGAFSRLSRTAAVMWRGRKSFLGAEGEEPDLAKLEELVLSLGELKGIAMKMGQILSYVDDSLPDSARRVMALLRTWSPTTPFAELEPILRAELGERAETLLAAIVREPVASASIGQVHRATLPDGTALAVKLRHPGIDEAIKADFRSARIAIPFAKLMAPGVDVGELIAEARAGFLEECDYRLEAQRQARFAELFRGHPVIDVPGVRTELSGERVLCTEWRDGRSFDEFVDAAPSLDERNRVGRALYQFYVGSLYRYGLFNADPHPGNLLFAPDGKVVILDHGCVRHFDADTVAAIAALSRAVRDDDERRVRDALGWLGARKPTSTAQVQVTRELLRGFFAPLLEPGPHRMHSTMAHSMADIASTKRKAMKLHLPGRLLFLFRIRFGLYAVLARLGAELDWAAIEDEEIEGR